SARCLGKGAYATAWMRLTHFRPRIGSLLIRNAFQCVFVRLLCCSVFLLFILRLLAAVRAFGSLTAALGITRSNQHHDYPHAINDTSHSSRRFYPSRPCNILIFRLGESLA